MSTGVIIRETPKIGVIAARLSIGAVAVTRLLLASLHILSPPFDPSFRMVSEYVLGQYYWVLSLMFLAWGVRVCGRWQSRFGRRYKPEPGKSAGGF